MYLIEIMTIIGVIFMLFFSSSSAAAVYFFMMGDNEESQGDNSGSNDSGNDSDNDNDDGEPQMTSPHYLFDNFKNSGEPFRLGVFENGSLKCVRIDEGGDNKFDDKDDIHTRGCDSNDEFQKWTYDATSRKIKTVAPDKNGRLLCLDHDSSKDTSKGGKFKVTKCDDNPQKNRQHTFVVADDADVTNVGGNPRWESSHQNVRNAIPSRIRPDSAINGNCIMNPSRHSDKRTEVCNNAGTRMYIMTD